MACGTSVADVCASRVGLLVVVVSIDVDEGVVAGAVVVVVVCASGISACLNLASESLSAIRAHSPVRIFLRS